MNRALTNTVCTVLLIASRVSAWGFHDAQELGTPLVCASPMSTAMGSVWSLPSSGPASIFLNPAELAEANGTDLLVSSGWIQWSTDVYGEYEFQHGESGTIPGPLTAALGFGLTDRFNAAVGVSNVADFSFDGVNMVLVDLGPGLYEIGAVDNLDSRGSLWEINAGIGAEVTDWLSLGVSAGVRNGSGSWTLFHNDLTGPADSTSTGDWDETAACFHCGVLMDAGIGTIGISTVSGSDMYSDRLAAGFQREFDVIDGRIGIEFDSTDPFERGDFSGRLFIAPGEMIANVRSVYSIGFVKAAEHHRTAACLATGTSVSLGDVDLDLVVSWRSRSRAGHSVPDYLVTVVDDSGTYYLVGLRWAVGR